MSHVIQVDDLDAAIEQYRSMGYRLDMIFPADNPREALLSEPPAGLSSDTAEPTQRKQIRLQLNADGGRQPTTAGASGWVVGRAGMEYRDLIPDRMGGQIIASHIRLTRGGEVPDYVHYHKIEFQMIYCLRGRIKVVYEDQGPPFWLETGDCILQPPEIRHRVLECTAGAEVIELSMPPEHETWVEHEITLPTARLRPDRDFSGQRFLRHMASNAIWEPGRYEGYEQRDTGVLQSSGGIADVVVLRRLDDISHSVDADTGEFVFPLEDGEHLLVRLR